MVVLVVLVVLVVVVVVIVVVVVVVVVVAAAVAVAEIFSVHIQGGIAQISITFSDLTVHTTILERPAPTGTLDIKQGLHSQII